MNVLYDWIGSLQQLPLCFNLTNFKGDILKSFESVEDAISILNMAEYDNPPSLEKDEEITIPALQPVNSSL